MKSTNLIKTYPHQERSAECLVCGLTWTTANAMGAAAKHAKAWRHTVEGYSSLHFRYTPAEEPSERPYEANEDQYGLLYEERD